MPAGQPTEAAPETPTAFGRYTLLERLAVGGMAEVFRAKITSSHGFEKIVVIKRILPHLAADENFVAMFIDEAKLTAQLTHPKIVQILDFGEVGGQYFTALEYIEGFDALGLLRVAAQKRVHVPRALAAFIVCEILEALDYAHSAREMDGRPMQIVHRDISPSNIFLSKRGDVKLGDFGIAHAERRETSKTQVGALKGKYGYMSPEQVVGRPIDARSDLFAVGVVLAELLTGRRLFTAPADLDVLLKVRDARLDRLDKYGGDLPPALNAIVRKALKKDPGERYQTAVELRDALADYLFSIRQRVSAADMRGFSAALFDASEGGAARLARLAHPMNSLGGVRPSQATGPAVPDVRAPTHEAAGAVLEPTREAKDLGGFISGAPEHPPDSAGDVSIITPMRLLCDLALAGETGLLRFERGFERGLDRAEVQKEIFLVGGAPESISSNDPSERFGAYLVKRGVLGPDDLEVALGLSPQYNGKLGDTLVALGVLRPLDVFRLLSQQVRDRVIDVFAWTEGTFSFHRGVTNQQENFPLGLDTFEILGAGVVGLPRELLEQRFAPMLDYHPIATRRARVQPESFRIGPTPRELLGLLDGGRSLRDWVAECADPDELTTFLRALYLLVETDLAELD